MNDLTILTVAYNDEESQTLDLMIRSVLKFTNPEPKFIICDNGRNNLEKYKSLTNFTIIDNTGSKTRGSLQHGESLNKIFPLVTTTRAAIIESDCALLVSGWDIIDFPKHKMLAAKKGELAGQPFYHVCFSVFSAGLLQHGGDIDFRPGKDGNRGNRNYKAHEDVGCKLREKIRADQVQLMEFVDCKTGKGKVFNDKFQSDELWLNGIPIVAHFGRGSNLSGKADRPGFAPAKQQLIEWKKIVEGILA